ncbi:germination protein YpeB [Shouchella shacheensis]|uniref:germination protein YpeB n=1 Tax=Shouchella shacheensis TaxID=1649580 RepID=UPI00073FB56E|nr:germination protein YpeB [Shouchella shacheensis]
MIRNITIAALAIAVAGTGYWGYTEMQQKEQLQISKENDYQRAFHDLTYHVDQIEDDLGKTLAMNSQRQLTPALANVWRATSLAENNMAELPVQGLELSEAEEYLFKVADFANRTAIRDLDNEPLSDKEYETLTQLYEQSGSIRENMRESQAMMMQQHKQWLDMDEELAHEPKESSVAGNFEKMNESVKGFSEVEWGATDSAIRNLNGELKEALAGREKVSKEEAKEKALEYLQLGEGTNVQISDAAEALEYPAYSLVIDDPDRGANYSMDMSVEGGEPIWFLQDRQIDQASLGLNEASDKAQAFLERGGKESMQLVDSNQYDNIGVFEFAHVEDDVRVYPDSVTIEVALDDGDVISYVGRGHLIHHDNERDIPEPAITKEEAEANVNPQVQIMEDHLAMIENDVHEKVLAYEFYGTINNDTYRIFINAETGEEEKVDRMHGAEPVYNFAE